MSVFSVWFSRCAITFLSRARICYKRHAVTVNPLVSYMPLMCSKEYTESARLATLTPESHHVLRMLLGHSVSLLFTLSFSDAVQAAFSNSRTRKNRVDIFSRLSTMHERHRQTGRQTNRQILRRAEAIYRVRQKVTPRKNSISLEL